MDEDQKKTEVPKATADDSIKQQLAIAKTKIERITALLMEVKEERDLAIFNMQRMGTTFKTVTDVDSALKEIQRG